MTFYGEPGMVVYERNRTPGRKNMNVLKQKKSVADDVVDNWRQYFRVEEELGCQIGCQRKL